ncbi:hypothetical protein [Flavobacterium succinicans]|uniref:6-bladed beta-propeller protein n=1 Tax=Flavobacterium succinicans TaxID=29536 RepID=A0A199XVB3_9FLAO|nr:hypothetical protein [Flavobacterium succinicans]OAZ05259.1 hypothetical protein FLB_03500 [Flavobacterium succinicans]
MKKRILLVGALQLFMVLGSCSSDSDNNIPVKKEELQKGEIKADFIFSNSVDDFVINNDDTVFFIGQTPNDKDYRIKFQKIDKNGNLTLLNGISNSNFFTNRLAVTPTGDFLLIDTVTDKIFRFESNFTELNPFYTMKPISSPFASKIRLTAITENNDNTYFVFDYNNKQMKRFVPELNTDVFVAGSGKNEIVDGAGLDASFGNVTRIISKNNALYLIDNLRTGTPSTFISSNIRKLEYVNNQWKVTTLISTTNKDASYNDIAFDSKNDLYVSVREKGVYKLNLSDNTMSLFKDGELKVVAFGKNSSSRITVDFNYLKSFKFKNNDLYLGTSFELIKISDFQTKFAAAEK